MRCIRFIPLSLFLLVLMGCGGGGGDIKNDNQPPGPVTVTISPTSVFLEVGDSKQFTSDVNRENFAVKWFVNNIEGGDATVGTITATGLYSAPSSVPSPEMITVKGVPEADTSKSATAQVTITAKLTISPTQAIVPAKQTQQFSANKAANWFVNDISGGNATVGTISADGLYRAPDAVPAPDTVNIKAAWQRDSSKTAQGSVRITAASTITISPTVIKVAAGAQQAFSANMAVDWQVSGAPGEEHPLGTIDASGVYTAPAAPPLSGSVTVTAISKADPTQKAIALVTITFSNASLNGHYAFRFRGAQPSGIIFVTGSFMADGSGRISNAVYDANDLVLPVGGAPFNATYAIGEDGRGVLTIVLGADQIEWRLVMINTDSARLEAFGDQDSGAGTLERQDAASFASGVSGTFTFVYDGVSAGNKPVVAAGMFSVDGAGNLNSGLQDINDNGTAQGNVNFMGSLSSADAVTGRGAMSVRIGAQTVNYAYYLLSADAFLFSSETAETGRIGLALRQSGGPYSNASLPGDSVLMFTGGSPGNPPTSAFGIGRFSSNSAGALTDGVEDVNTFGGKGVNIPFSGNYTINPNGHGYAALVRSTATDNLALYMIAPGKAFFVTRDPWMAASGQIFSQIGAPFSAGLLNGRFGFLFRGTQIGMATDIIGVLDINGAAGTISGMADIKQAGIPTEGRAITGTFTMAANGRGEALLNFGIAESRTAIYLCDSDNFLLIEAEPRFSDKIGLAGKQFGN